jgi:DNA helicase-2/ATP-dependent DNA helicase PcrA
LKPIIHKIYGPPGTGKTTRLIDIVREAVKGGMYIDRIAYIAHTKAAADEAYDRMRKHVGGKRPRYFCTIHAAARRIIGLNREHIWGGGEWAALTAMTRMRFNVGAEFDDERNSDVIGDPLVQCINFAKARMIPVYEAMQNFERYEVVSPSNVAMIEAAMKQIKKERDKFDFDDILQMYSDHPAPIPADLVLVDEAQDLSVFQWKVGEQMWANCKRVVICGDDDQSIYSFLGADPDGFLKFPADTQEVLPVSWRVPRNVGRVAEKIIGPVKNRQKKNLIWRDEDGSVTKVFADKHTLPIKAGETTMVLVRHNIQGRAVYKAIREEGVPCAYNGESYLLDKEAKALSIYHKLRMGEEVSWTEAITMLEQMPGKERSAAWARQRKTAADEKRKKLSKDDFDIKFIDNPVSQFGVSLAQMKLYALLCWNVEKFGVDVLLKQPDVNVMTIHASKGREADHVIIIPDCYTSVWEGQDGKERDTERKVAYVAVTRARHRLTMLYPRSDMFVRALTEAV